MYKERKVKIFTGINLGLSGLVLVWLYATRTLPSSTAVWLVIILWIVYIIVRLLIDAKPIDVEREMRHQGWTVIVPLLSEAQVPTHLFRSTSIEEAIIRPLYLGTKVDQPMVAIVYGKNTYRMEDGTVSNFGTPFLYARHTLTRSISGWVKVRPAALNGQSTPDIKLESYEFNQRFDVRAEPPNLATFVLSPDIMSWYMDLDPKPTIHVEGSQCTVLYKQEIISAGMLRDVITMATSLAEKLEHSGALVKNT